MNSLVPAGVEAYFNKEKNIELELQMLRHFFSAWENLHNVPHDKDHRKKAEAAAQVLVDAAQAIYTLRGDGVKEIH